MKNSKHALSAIVAGIVSTIFVTAITVIADLAPALKDSLKDTFSHHWLGKSILTVSVFLLFYFLVYVFAKETDEPRPIAVYVKLLSFFSVFGTLVIFLFFVYEAFLK